MKMRDYQLGEMRGANGSSLRYEVERRSSELAIGVSEVLKSTRAYMEISGRLPSRRLQLYFQYLLKKEIYPYVRQASVIEWHKRNSSEISEADRVVRVPAGGIFPVLMKCWDYKDAAITSTSSIFPPPGSLRILGKRIRDTLLKKPRNRSCPQKWHDSGCILACHYAEGFDPFRRNDLNWYDGSGISPGKVLIYFDSPDNKSGKPVRKEVIKKLTEAGFSLVAMKEGIIEGGDFDLWTGPEVRQEALLGSEFAGSPAENWVREAGNALIRSVEYWRSFYKDYNIRINYISEEGTAKNFAQAIAFDIDGEGGGLLVGKQRSEAFFPYKYILGHHPKHVFFMWNVRAAGQLDPESEMIENVVLTGYTYDVLKRSRSFKGKMPSDELRSRGVRIVVALLDDMHGRDFSVSTDDMARFYTAFFGWALGDNKVGLILKSKKPIVIKKLPDIKAMLVDLISTGRCIKLDDEWGRYPSDASMGADFAVGAGISTAVIESVLSGCRGIHYDVSRLTGHEFYKWGRNKIIFNDLDAMMGALKRYLSDPRGESGLGDWSEYLEELDPFRDWKGGQRMGQYMRILLESFDKGMTRSDALRNAARLYRKIWGNDKVINMEPKNG